MMELSQLAALLHTALHWAFQNGQNTDLHLLIYTLLHCSTMISAVSSLRSVAFTLTLIPTKALFTASFVPEYFILSLTLQVSGILGGGTRVS